MNILVITPNYPSRNHSVYTFVKQLIDQFSRMGHNCCVVAPFSICKNKGFIKEKEVYEVEDGCPVTILRPNHLSFSEMKLFGCNLSELFRSKALYCALRNLPFQPDVIYGHFWQSGREIYKYASSQSLPLFVATGESVIPKAEVDTAFKPFYDYVRGVICVSTKNKKESIQNGMTSANKCIVVPNAINSNLFRRLDRAECRRQLNLPQDIFIAAFCGAFIHRKGVKILSDAIDSIQGEPVYSLFIGRPLEELPSCRNILYQGPVDHESVPIYLNAANVFVLPTLHEGCCNAIIEAMACGLPIISSDRAFNWDILNDSNSIMIDPNDTVQVANAIIELRDNRTRRETLSAGASQTASNLTIEKRAEIILEFINNKI